MPTLHVRLFGPFAIDHADQVGAGLTSTKARELLCYLLLHRDRPHAREPLAVLLWGDISAAQARTYLRKAIWQVQHALDNPEVPGNGGILRLDHDWIGLNPQTPLCLDVALFEDVYAQVQALPGASLDAPMAQAVQAAVDLYQGDLLEGWYQEWCLCARERLQNMYLALLDKLMAYCETHQAYDTGIAYGARMLHYDRANERTHQRLMRLHYRAGDRTAALHQYTHCVAALAEELGVPPRASTVALYDQIRQDQFADPALGLTQTLAAPPEAVAPLQAILDRLTGIQQTLADIQGQVHQDMQTIETLVRAWSNPPEPQRRPASRPLKDT